MDRGCFWKEEEEKTGHEWKNVRESESKEREKLKWEFGGGRDQKKKKIDEKEDKEVMGVEKAVL